MISNTSFVFLLLAIIALTLSVVICLLKIHMAQICLGAVLEDIHKLSKHTGCVDTNGFTSVEYTNRRFDKDE